MTVNRAIGVDERRARLGRRHALAVKATDPVAATAAVVVLHATDPATVFLAALARMVDPDVDAVADALYEERSLVRVLAMRRTLFVARVEDLTMIERSSTDKVARTERARLVGFLTDTGIADPDRWLAEAAAEVTEALADEPAGVPARTLTARIPRLATKIVMGAGTRNAGTAGATSRVLAVLANEGVLVRGRPAGAWTGRQYTWHLREHWLADGDPHVVGRSGGEPLTEAEAQRRLLAAWLAAFGPGTMTDLRWWTGWTAADVKRALAGLDTVDVDLPGPDGAADVTQGIILADDLEPEHGPGPWAALLPSLDPTAMGWKDRQWYLSDHEGPLFDRNGNIGPTVWVDGRIVGGWSQRPDGEIAVELLEDVGADHRALIDADAARLAAAIGDTVVKPSFPTPLQKRLATS